MSNACRRDTSRRPFAVKPVTNTGFSQDARWLAWLRLNLLPQLSDKDAQGTKVVLIPWTPDFTQKLPLRQHAISISDKESQQVILGGREMDFGIVAQHLTTAQVDGQLAEAVDRHRFLQQEGMAERNSQAREKLILLNGLVR